MQLLLDHWPVVFVCFAMIAAAIIDGWKFKVPNWLTFPLILSGWGLGALHDCGLLESTGVGGIGASLAGTAIGFILLFPLLAIKGMGAGDVKMQMGFGAWVGAFYGMHATESHPGAGWIVIYAFCFGAIIGGVISLVMMLLRRDYKQNLTNMREILQDVLGLNPFRAAENAAKRRPRQQPVPYGVPLCLGFISYLFYMHGA